MMEPEKAGTRFISSTALLARTGISRATLNNYINMGMISSPIIGKPDDPASKARQIGYFRDTVLDKIEKVRLYKQKGHSMKEIASLLSLKNDDLAANHDTGIPVNGPEPNEKKCSSAECQEISRGNMDSVREEISRLQTGDGGIADDDDLPLSDLERFKQPIPLLISFSVLVAKLHNSVRISAELPPEEYFALHIQIRESVKDCFKRHYGTYAKQTRDGMVLYFLRDRNSRYLVNSILCAMDIKNNIKKLSEEWKRKKGWFNELCLNIGINEGEEYFEGMPASAMTEFTPIGESDHCADHLSDIANFGSIWTTKNLMKRLTDDERKKIRYGIRHLQNERDILIENIFSRIMDLIPTDNSKDFKFLDIATAPVTEILNLRY